MEYLYTSSVPMIVSATAAAGRTEEVASSAKEML
jgi:hypothetical protein